MTDYPDPELIRAIKHDEGLVLAAYPDPLSPRGRALVLPLAHRPVGWAKLSGAPWTIGYGHTGPDVFEGLTITQAQADALLIKDLTSHNATLSAVLPWVNSLSGARRRVLQNMHFNMGWDNPRTSALEGLSGFVNTLRMVRIGQYVKASEGMLASQWARQVGARATRLSKAMKTDADVYA